MSRPAAAEIREALGFFSTFLLVFAAIGLVVACFTIYNTFQIIVTQRSREMALLRSVGATRGQVLRAQLLEALIVGTIASVAGFVAGVLVASGLKAMMESFGIDIPAGGTAFQARTAVVAMVVGTVVTIGSAVFPSLRASRVPPLAAMRDVTTDGGPHQVRRRLLQGGALLISIANSMSLSIHERTHEFGLLRAVGMTRHQTGSAVRWEAAIIGVGALGGVLAAVRPGWRAAHLDILRAIASE